MEFGISTLALGQAAVTVDTLETLRKKGFKHIELHANRPELDFHDKGLMRSIANWFAENELPSPSLHLPFEEPFQPGVNRPLSVAATSSFERQYAMDEIKRCLELVERVDTAYVVLHLGVPGQQFHPTAFDHAYAAVATIQSFSGAQVLLENLQNGIAVPSRIQEFIRVAQLRDVRICYDIGHGSVAGAFADSVSAFHISDNDGRSDLHQWPFEGTTDWTAFVERMTVAGYDGPLILEARETRLAAGIDAMRRLQDLIDEARSSIDEFRLKYKLAHTNSEETDDSNLH